MYGKVTSVCHYLDLTLVNNSSLLIQGSRKAHLLISRMARPLNIDD